MNGLYKQFETDPKLEVEGIWLEYEDPDGESPVTRIRIARAGGANTAFQKEMERRAKPIRRQIQNEAVSLKQITKLNQEVYAKTVVLAWENVSERDGTPMAFSEENVVKLFEALPDLWADVEQQAQKSVLFRTSMRELEAKN